MGFGFRVKGFLLQLRFLQKRDVYFVIKAGEARRLPRLDVVHQVFMMKEQWQGQGFFYRQAALFGVPGRSVCSDQCINREPRPLF
jgi:hypothetical protein